MRRSICRDEHAHSIQVVVVEQDRFTLSSVLEICFVPLSEFFVMLFPEQLVQVGARTELACAFSTAIFVFAFERDFGIVVSFRKELFKRINRVVELADY